MLDGESSEHGLLAFTRLKCDDCARVTAIDNCLCWTGNASDRNRFAVIVDVFTVGSGRDENEIGIISHIDRLLNRWLIGRNVNDGRTSCPDQQTDRNNNENARRIG